MSLFSQFVPGVKPLRIVEYTSGTSTFTPANPGNWCRVTVVSGGNGGAKTNSSTVGGGGGAAGGVGVHWVRVSGPVTVVVGAGGAGSVTGGVSGALGSASRFGAVVVSGPNRASGTFENNGGDYPGGMLSATSPSYLGFGFTGENGGIGVSGSAGTDGPNGGGTGGTGTGGGGGGGAHIYGVAGNGGNSGSAGGNATGYAAGGGGSGSPTANGGNGAGGLVIVEEFGV